MRVLAPLAATLLLALPHPAAAATALEALRARLAGLEPEGTIRARIDVRSESRSSEEPGTSSGGESVVAELGQDGLRLLWSGELVAAAREAAWRAQRDPNAVASGTSLGQVPPDEAANLLDHADRLLMALDGATLLEQRPDASRGPGGHLMRLAPKRNLSAADEKVVKKWEDVLTLWLDREGWPVASERQVEMRGSKMLVSFGSKRRVTRELRLVANRLVITSEHAEGSGQGLGSEGSDATVTTVTLLP